MKNSCQEKKKTKLSKIGFLKGMLFVFCAIPGVLIFMFYAFDLFAYFSPPRDKGLHWIITIPGMIVGLLLVLIGTGKLKQWLYVFVFISLPISMLLIVFIGVVFKVDLTGHSLIGFLVLLGLSMYLVERALIKKYKKNEIARDSEEKR